MGRAKGKDKTSLPESRDQLQELCSHHLRTKLRWAIVCNQEGSQQPGEKGICLPIYKRKQVKWESELANCLLLRVRSGLELLGVRGYSLGKGEAGKPAEPRPLGLPGGERPRPSLSWQKAIRWQKETQLL